MHANEHANAISVSATVKAIQSLKRLSVWFTQLPASIPPASRTVTPGVRHDVVTGAIERLEDAHCVAIDELRDAIIAFRNALHAERTPRQREASLARAWHVYRATRTLRNVEAALVRLRRERHLWAGFPGDSRATLPTVATAAA